MPAVSVIIPTFNRAEKVVRAVKSVLQQSYDDFEVIVMDDGSTDNTQQMLRDYRPWITYLHEPTNRGVSAARNSGIENSGAPWVAFLDSDDYWLDDKLALQMEFFAENPSAVACQTEEIWIRGGRRVNARTRHRKPSGDIFEQSLKLCLVSPSSVMVKRSLFAEVGVFDETLMAAEDYDLWLRISCRYPVFLVDKALIIKEGGHADQLSRRFTGMDRFRIKAIVKVIKGGVLSPDQERAAMDELAVKCGIYGSGCMKRGRREEADFYLSLPERLRSRKTVRLAVPGNGEEW